MPERRWTWWDWDPVRDERSWDDNVRGLLGNPDWPLQGPSDTWWARVHEEDRERIRSVVATSLRVGGQWSLTYRLSRADGTWLTVRDRGWIVPHDVSQLRGHGSVIEVSHARPSADPDHPPLETETQFRDFVDWLPQLAWSATPDGWIDWYNRRWFEYTGTTLESMEGWGWVSVHDPADLPRVLANYREAFRSGALWEDEFRLRRGSDGAMRWHLSRAMPLRDARGRIVRWFGTNTDVHDQKLAAEAFSRMLIAEKQARRAAQEANQAKDEFLAVISHELRTPLTAMLGWTQLLTLVPGALEDPVRVKESVARIEANAVQQAKLVDDLLDLSRVLAGKLEIPLEPVDLSALVATALSDLQRSAAEKAIHIESSQPPRLLVRGQAARLRQILNNLVENAIKFSPEGGRIEVRVERVSDARVALVVQDWGEGIGPELLPHVFERFRQSDSSHRRRHMGLGLGLSIVKHLVEAHGGTVRAESAGPGTGACFTVVLPMADSLARPEAALDPERTTITPLIGISILLVDDELSTRDVVGEILLAAGATVTRTGSAQEALRALRRGLPDVLISDIAMPDLDGYGLIERVRGLPDDEAAALPCIALTAHASEDDQERALSSGFDHYLSKPIDAIALTHLVARAVRASYEARRAQPIVPGGSTDRSAPSDQP